MVLVSRLHDTMDGDGADVFAGERAVMGDIAHARSFLSNHGCKTGQSARTIANDGRESTKPSVCRQTTFDNAPQDVRIDIPSAQRQHYFFARQLGDQPCKTGGEWS